MDLGKIRRLSARLLKVGENKIWLNPAESEKIKEALTKEDVRGLIADKLIKARKVAGTSRSRAKKLQEKKKKGLKKGQGKRTGTKKARVNKKKAWIRNVRAQRATLKNMKKKEVNLKKSYSKIYKMIKGGYFKGKKYLETMAEEKK
ncbi:MAG: 50S ribosomal protein L19e [Candidatus Diapherotrites archaeon]